MVLLVCTFLLFAAPSWAQQPALALVAGRDSLGVGDTLEVRVWVDARGRLLTSASAVVVLERRVFAPLSETPFVAGDFLPGQAYDNAAAAEGNELRLRYVAVSGAPEEGGRPAATGQGELARFRVRAIAPAANTLLRLEGVGAHRSMYTAPDQPGVEQRFELPGPLQLRVSAPGVLVLPATGPISPEPLPAEPALPEAPENPPENPPPNTPPRIAAPAGLAVAAGGESQGPLLASFLRDAEEAVEALQVEIAGDAHAAGWVEKGRLVVRGLQAGRGLLTIRVADSQGAWASAQVEVLVRAAGQGPLLRALPRVALRVGGEKVLDLAAYVFDPDTPLTELSWSLAIEGGVEAELAGTLLHLRGRAAGPARLSLRVADPEGNAGMAALAVQVEEEVVAPALPADTVAVPADPVPEAAVGEPPFPAEEPSGPEPSTPPAPPEHAAPLPGDSPGTAQGAAAPADTAAPELPEGNQAQPGAEAPAIETGEGEAGAEEVQISPPAAPEVQVSPPVAPAPESGTEILPDSAQALPAAPEAPTPLEAAPFAPIAETPLAPVPAAPDPPGEAAAPAAPTSPGEAAAPAEGALVVEEAVAYQLVAGRVDSGLVADAWVREGEARQVRWSLRGGKRLEARLDQATGRLYLDARLARPGREVLFAEAVLGAARRQVVLTIDVRAPRLALLPFPALDLALGQQLALDLDSYVEGDFAPEELSWSAEAPAGAGVELDAAARVLRLWNSGGFPLRLRVASPWGNQAEVLLEVRGILPPAGLPPDTAAAAIPLSPPPPLPTPTAAPEPPSPPPASLPPADEDPPQLWLEGLVQGEEVEFRVRADEELGLAPVVRVNGLALEVAGAGKEYRALYAPQAGQLQVQAEAADLAGNAAQVRVSLAAYQVEPGAARLGGPGGGWQVSFPRARQPALVLFREEGEVQWLDFDARRTGPAELVARYRGDEAPAILRRQGGGWEALPTYALAGGGGVFAQSEGSGAFKLGGRATAALPLQPLVYPNPFNARTAIRYQVPSPGRVRVRVRDGQGRIARELVDQVQGPGVWTAAWDGGQGDGQAAASGVYFYEVETAGRRWTGKLLLLR